MNEQTPEIAPVEVEQAPVEQIPVEQAPVEQVHVETAPAPQEIPALDLSDLTLGFESPAVEPAPVPQFTPEQIAEMVAEKLAQKQIPVEENDIYGDVDEDRPLTRRELQRIIDAQEAKRVQRQQAIAIITHNQQQSHEVQSRYIDKLTKTLGDFGLDLKADMDIRETVDTLYKAKTIEMAIEKGRLFVDENGRPIDPVFTAQETAELVSKHYDAVAKTLLKTRTKVAPVQTASLSPAVNAVQEQALPVLPKSEYEQFMQKKASGKETLSDAIALLNKIPMERRSRQTK